MAQLSTPEAKPNFDAETTQANHPNLIMSHHRTVPDFPILGKDQIEGNWAIILAFPDDFTPIATSELIEFAKKCTITRSNLNYSKSISVNHQVTIQGVYKGVTFYLHYEINQEPLLLGACAEPLLRTPIPPTSGEATTMIEGLNLEGHCQNQQSNVIVPWGYRNDGVFDFFRNEGDATCPACGGYVEVQNFIFHKTRYKAVGCKMETLDGPYRDVNSDWKFAYHTAFLDDPSSLVYWGQLRIEVQRP